MEKFSPRKEVLSISPQGAITSMEEMKKKYRVNEMHRMNANENPVMTSKKAIEAMRREVEQACMYPETGRTALRAALAKKFAVEEDMVLLGNGGDQLLIMLSEAFLNAGEEVIVPDPFFATYALGVSIIGGRLVKVPVKKDGLTMDLDAMRAAITDKTKLIFLCNPNNPTATIVHKREVEAFMQAVPEHTLVVFDEAYHEFVSDPEYPDGMDYVKAERNVAVIRTFSKVYGLAGLRVGYCIAPRAIMDILTRISPVFPVNRIAQAGALAALEDTEFLAEAKRVCQENRAYFMAQFDAMGLPYAKPEANFIFVDTGLDAVQVNEGLLRRGFAVRPGGGWGFPTYLRVSFGTREQNEAFIAALKEVRAELA